MVSDDPGESDEFTALDAAGDESRMRIIQALVEHRREHPRDPGLPFSALREATGIRDSGRFNYHLDKLRNRFVEESDGEYQLTYAGRKLAIALVSGAYESGVTKESTAFGTCPRDECDATLLARYEGGYITAVCEHDHSAFRTGFPPGAAVDRSMEELFEVVMRTVFSDLEMALEGVCPYCYGTVDPDIELDDFEGESVHQFRASCTRCGTHITTAPGFCVLTDPDVRSFFREHGQRIYDRYPWEYDFLFDTENLTVVSEEPLRLETEVELSGDRLRVTVDESGRVAGTERSN